MIEDYIYNNDNSEFMNDLINNIKYIYLNIHKKYNDEYFIRLFNEEYNEIQIQIERNDENFYILDIELKNEYIYIYQSIIDSHEIEIFEDRNEIFRINNLIFEDDNIYHNILYNFIRFYLKNLYDIDILNLR